MGLLSLFKRRQKAPPPFPVMREIVPPQQLIEPPRPVQPSPPDAQELRRQLFDAAASGDEQQLTCLCQRHENSIFEQGLIWSNVPSEIRENPTLLRWYGNGLTAIATFCAQRLGKPELMDKVKQMQALPDSKSAPNPDNSHP